jgi:hypothetical protein
MGSATALYIDRSDRFSNDLQNFFSSFSNYGSSSRRGYIKITKQNDLTWFQTYEFSATTDNTGWWTITISNVISDANFTNNDLCFISFNVSGPSGTSGTAGTSGTSGANGSSGTSGTSGTSGYGIPVGGTSGQVLAKIDSTNYNTQWVDQSGGGATVTNYANDRIITSDGTSTGLVGETNLNFSGGQLSMTASIKISGTFSGNTENNVSSDAIVQTVLLYLSNNC